MITVDFLGGSICLSQNVTHHHRRHGRATRENGSAFRRRRRRLVASTRRARWNGASSRLKFTRRSSLFFYPSHPLECKCFHRVETDIAFSLSLFVVVIVVVSFVKRVSRGVVSLTTRSLSSLSISPPYRIARAHANRNRRPAATRRRRTKGPKRTSKTFPCRANTKTCKRKC